MILLDGGECNEIIQIELLLTSRALLQKVVGTQAFQLCNLNDFFFESLMNSKGHLCLAHEVAIQILLLTVVMILYSRNNLWYLDKQFRAPLMIVFR